LCAIDVGKLFPPIKKVQSVQMVMLVI